MEPEVFYFVYRDEEKFRKALQSAADAFDEGKRVAVMHTDDFLKHAEGQVLRENQVTDE